MVTSKLQIPVSLWGNLVDSHHKWPVMWKAFSCHDIIMGSQNMCTSLGFEYQRFIKLQKRFLRIISLSNYNAHTEPIFKRLEIITIKNLFDLNCLKFVYNYKKGELPDHFLKFRCVQRASIHDHETRFSSLIDSEQTRTVMAENCMRHHLVTVLNCTPNCILDKIATHSRQGFVFYVKRYYLNQLSNECTLRQCYVCNK